MSIDSLNFLVALGTVGMQVLAVVLFALYFLRNDPKFSPIAAFVSRWGLWFSVLLTFVSVVMSLVYSEYFGLIPCSLCWFQRIFLYPQLFLFLMAAWKKDSYIADYSIVLSVFGGAIALYQHYIQMVGESPLPCPAGGGDCVKRFLFEFGYITFPLVAFSAFALLIVVMLFVRNRRA